MTMIKRKLIPVVIIGGGIGAFALLVGSRPAPKRNKAAFQAPLVDTFTASSTTTRILISSQGTVVPAQQITLLPEVAGRINWVSKNFVPGGRFKRGETIARIDARNYEAIVAQRKAQLQQALLNLELEKGKKRVAVREWDLLKQELRSQSAEGKALALREPQLQNAMANVSAAEQALRKASLDLARTNLKAPFNCVVLTRNADLGQIVSAARPLANLAGTDAFWVEANIPLGHVAYLQLPNAKKRKGSATKVIQQSENQVSERQGFVTRVLSNLDSVGRMARVVIEIDKPLSPEVGELPLFLGSFTQINIEGREVHKVYEIPEEVVRNNDEVFVLTPKNELDIRKIKIVWKSRKTVLVEHGLKDGEKIISTRIPTPVQGMKLRTKAEVMKRRPIPGERS